MVVPRTLTIYLVLQYHSIHYTTGSNVHCTELNIKQQQKTSGKRNTVVQDTPHEYPRYYTELKPLKHQNFIRDTTRTVTRYSISDVPEVLIPCSICGIP